MHDYTEAWKYIAAGGGTALLFAIGGGVIGFLSQQETTERLEKIGPGVLIGAIVGVFFGPAILAWFS